LAAAREEGRGCGGKDSHTKQVARSTKWNTSEGPPGGSVVDGNRTAHRDSNNFRGGGPCQEEESLARESFLLLDLKTRNDRRAKLEMEKGTRRVSTRERHRKGGKVNATEDLMTGCGGGRKGKKDGLVRNGLKKPVSAGKRLHNEDALLLHLAKRAANLCPGEKGARGKNTAGLLGVVLGGKIAWFHVEKSMSMPMRP